jgi:Eukaryotic aspartyl protease
MSSTSAGLRVPITNVYGGGDYTAQIEVGSGQVRANVILDTGSSTLAVVPKVYDVRGDSDAKPTALAQDVIYGTGGWAGPVVTTKVALIAENQTAALDTYIAITIDDERRGFGAADGILGLAYNVLNNAFDLTGYLRQHGGQAVTYPWPFPVKNTSAAVQKFATFVQRMPEQDLPPYFTALNQAGIEKNLFAFYTLRSVPSSRSAQPESDPLNQGYFIMGGGPEQTDLYSGTFQDVAVVDDAWYNTDLLSVQVAGGPAHQAAPVPAQYAKTMLSNSIVDSGTNSLALAPDVLQAIATTLQQLDPAFAKAIQQAQQQGSVANSSLDLAKWPEITFTLKGATGQPVALTCSPNTYWQVDCPQSGQATFLIGSSGMPQSILGLPLMNNYYCVFDRTESPYGVIRFAPIKS